MVWMAPLFKFKDFGFFPKLMNLNPQQFDDSIIYISGYVSERSSSFVLGVFIFRSVNIPDHLPFSSNHLGVFPYEARWNMILCCKLTSWCWLFAPQISFMTMDNSLFLDIAHFDMCVALVIGTRLPGMCGFALSSGWFTVLQEIHPPKSTPFVGFQPCPVRLVWITWSLIPLEGRCSKRCWYWGYRHFVS